MAQNAMILNMSDTPNRITSLVTPDQVQYWMHYVDHVELDPVQRQAAKHLREYLYRLLDHRDRVDEVRLSFEKETFSGAPAGNLADHARLHEATLVFFQTFYATISALSSFMIRIARPLGLDSPSANSIGKFIKWMKAERPKWLAVDGSLAEELENARAFRALIDHPASSLPYEWIMYNGDRGAVVRLMYFGPMRGNACPQGATANFGPLGESGWGYVAPDEVSVTNALMNVIMFYMPLIRGNLPNITEGVTCPDFLWEAGGNDDRPIHSEPLSFYRPDAGRVRLDTMGILENEDLTKGQARNSNHQGVNAIG